MTQNYLEKLRNNKKDDKNFKITISTIDQAEDFGRQNAY